MRLFLVAAIALPVSLFFGTLVNAQGEIGQGAVVPYNEVNTLLAELKARLRAIDQTEAELAERELELKRYERQLAYADRNNTNSSFLLTSLQVVASVLALSSMSLYVYYLHES